MADNASTPRYNGFEVSLTDEGDGVRVQTFWYAYTDTGTTVRGNELDILSLAEAADPANFVSMFKDHYDSQRTRLITAGYTLPTEDTGARYGFDTEE